MLNPFLNSTERPLGTAWRPRYIYDVRARLADTSLGAGITRLLPVAFQPRETQSRSTHALEKGQETYFLCLQKLQDSCGLARLLLKSGRDLPLGVFPGPHSTGSSCTSWSAIFCNHCNAWAGRLCFALLSGEAYLFDNNLDARLLFSPRIAALACYTVMQPYFTLHTDG